MNTKFRGRETGEKVKSAIWILAFSCVAGNLLGCATPLDSGAEKVRLISAGQKERCDSLGLVSTDQQLGLNKASNSMNKAINEVARRGGNGIYIVSSGMSGLDGAAVTAEALRCNSL